MVFLNLNLSRKGNPKMETKAYLVNTKFDLKNKHVQIDGNDITIQFKIMDKYSVVEIIGLKKGHILEEFKHTIICNKNQDITIKEPVNEQIELVDDLEPIKRQRIFIDRGSDFINPEDLANDKSEHYMLGLHGQLDLFKKETN